MAKTKRLVKIRDSRFKVSPTSTKVRANRLTGPSILQKLLKIESKGANTAPPQITSKVFRRFARVGTNEMDPVHSRPALRR